MGIITVWRNARDRYIVRVAFVLIGVNHPFPNHGAGFATTSFSASMDG